MEWLLLLVAIVWLVRLQARVARLEGDLKALAGTPPGAVTARTAAPASGSDEAAGTEPWRAADRAQEASQEPAPTTVPMALPLHEPDTVPMPLPSGAASVPADAAPSSRARVPEPDERSTAVTSSIAASVLAWFRGGNTIVRAGLVILFIGVAFLLRFAAEHSMLPIELRLAGVALGGIVLCGIGWRLRERRRGYGLSLQGGGIGVLYLVIFGALRLYALLPAPLAFALLAGLAAVTALLAVLQDALPLAVLAFGGGFLAPVFASTGHGSHVALFSYYLVLNLAIAWIASRQAWKLLNLVGFGFTFAIATAWGLKSYTPEIFASTELFLALHFALYLFICVQYSRQLVAAKDEAKLRYVDGGLLFGVPIAAFGLQAGIVKHLPYGLALSAVVFSAIYLLLGRWLWRQAGAALRLLTEGLLALGLVFFALVTPLALDARWTGAAWSVQGAGLLWIALRQQRHWAAGMGVLMQLAAAVSFWSVPREAALPLWLNAHLLGALLLGVSAGVSARLLLLKGEAAGLPEGSHLGLHWLMLMLGVLQSLGGLWGEWQLVDAPALDLAWRAALLCAAAAFVGEALQARLKWPELGVPARALVALAALASLGGLAYNIGASPHARFFGRWGWVEAIAVLGVGVWLQRRLEADRQPPWRSSGAAEHLLLAWYAMLQGGLQAWGLAGHLIAHHEAWTPLAAIVPPTLLAWWAAASRQRERWPAVRHPRAWRAGLMLPWALVLALWCLGVDAFADGAMQPLPYLPGLNPIDLGHVLALLYAAKLYHAGAVQRRRLSIGVAALGFVWLNAVLVRSLHHWAGTPMWIDGALDNGVVQTGLTLLWTALALLAMLFATRRAGPALARPVWLAGAVLLGVVVLKLFFVDLSSVGTLERIVSFLAVGVLMLVIGYVSPLPPAASAEAAR